MRALVVERISVFDDYRIINNLVDTGPTQYKT